MRAHRRTAAGACVTAAVAGATLVLLAGGPAERSLLAEATAGAMSVTHRTYVDAARSVDSAVVGRLTAVPGHGVDQAEHPTLAGERTKDRLVDFDEPTAHWRTLDVRIRVEEVLGGETVESFSWPFVGTPEEGRRIAVELSSFGRVLLLSDGRAGPEHVVARMPYYGYGLAVVGEGGRLTFPGAEAVSEEFLDGVDTIDELRRALREARGKEPGTT